MADKLDKMVEELYTAIHLRGSQRFPKAFYNLNDNQQAEVIKRYRERYGLLKEK